MQRVVVPGTRAGTDNVHGATRRALLRTEASRCVDYEPRARNQIQEPELKFSAPFASATRFLVVHFSLSANFCPGQELSF
eukprot:3936595-Rhodomonas_salina.2